MSKCRLIVFSDIHYLDERPNKLDFNLSRKLTQYSLEIIEKLINIINKRKPDVSICLGDLIEDTFNHQLSEASDNWCDRLFENVSRKGANKSNR